MAYSHPNLQRIGSAGDRPVLWLYNGTGDDVSDVTASGYFDDAADDLQVGDVIIAMCDDATRIFGVAGNSGGTVTTTNGVDLDQTDPA